MPAARGAFYRSSRIHRAYKINNVEQSKLQGTLNLLDKEKIHKVRLTNNDIRLISVTLDYIQSSSGHSAEGLAPESDGEEEESDDKAPCFLYGERIVSRKVSRFRRAHSALERTGSRREGEQSVTTSAAPSEAPSPRPQSTPAGRSRSISFADLTLKSENKSDDETSPVSSRPSTARPPWMDEVSPITKKLFQAQSSLDVSHGRLHERSYPKIRSHSVIGIQNVGRKSNLLERSRTSPFKSESNSGRKHSLPLDRNARLSDIINQRRPTLSASAWRSHLSQNKTQPTSVESHRQFVMDIKMRANDEDRNCVDRKVQKFISKLPNKSSIYDDG